MLSNLLQNAHEAGCKVLVRLCISCHKVKEGTNCCTHHTRVLVTKNLPHQKTHIIFQLYTWNQAEKCVDPEMKNSNH